MFTIKLCKKHHIRIEEAEAIAVYPAGPLKKIANRLDERSNDVRELQLLGKDKAEIFYIAVEPCWADENNATYEVAFIENSNGATTQIIKPY